MNLTPGPYKGVKNTEFVVITWIVRAQNIPKRIFYRLCPRSTWQPGSFRYTP